jgi:hypothetical protein
VSEPFKTVPPAIAEFGTSAGFATSETDASELRVLEFSCPSTTFVGRLTFTPAALQANANVGVSAAATPEVTPLSTATDATVRMLVTGKAAMRRRSPPLGPAAFIVSSFCPKERRAAWFCG